MNKGLEKIMEFEGQEIKVITDKGETLYNLVETAKILGITKNNKGSIVVNWKTGNANLVRKLESILSTICSCGDNGSTQYVDEIKYILDEIDNCEDRKSIYISSWTGKRLAMECKNDKAMRYKNWLATLDENYTKGELQSLDSNQFGMMSQQMQTMAQSMSQIGQAFQNIQTFVADSINSKDLQINDMRDMIGFRDINTKKLSKLLKQHVEEQCGHKVWATSKEYIEAKEKVFEHFDVLTWEQLPITLYQQARTYILTNF